MTLGDYSKRNQYVSERSAKLKKILSDISQISREESDKLITFLISEKYTLKEISKVLGVSKQALSKRMGGKNV